MAELYPLALRWQPLRWPEVLRARMTVARRNLLLSALLFLLAFFAFAAIQLALGISPVGVSINAHYVYQAYSLLHGHLDLIPAPGLSLIDTVQVGGKHYLVYPPLPALLLLPFVALFGLRTSDVLFTMLVSALDLPLLFLLFDRFSQLRLTRRGWRANLLLAALLYFGSITLWLSVGGEVWFTEQIVACCCTLLSLLLAFHRRWLWSALALAGAFFSRGTLALGFPFLLALAWYDVDPAAWPRPSLAALRAWRLPTSHGSMRRATWRLAWSAIRSALVGVLPGWRDRRVRRALPVALVAGAAVALFLARDALIFGSPFETGYGLTLAQNYPTIHYGVYSLHYVRMNLVANFLDVPHVIFTSPTDLHPTIDMLNGGAGISVFVTTPLFLYLFWHNARFSPLRAALWATIGVMVAQVLLYDWTGSYQFGARYLLDAYPYAFALLALGEIRIDWRVCALGALGILVNLLGAAQFWR